MLISSNKNKNNNILAIGAHPDDIEFGTAGFLLKSISEFDANIHIAIMTYGTYGKEESDRFEIGDRAKEALDSTQRLLNVSKNIAQKKLHFGEFQDCQLSNSGHSLIRYIEKLIHKIKPNIVLTHSYGDFHDDHRQVNRATVSAARNFQGSLLFYQSPSTIPNEFAPNFFVQLTKEEFNKKMSLLKIHSSQKDKRYMSSKHNTKIAEAWAEFHRMPEETKLEAFIVYKSFF